MKKTFSILAIYLLTIVSLPVLAAVPDISGKTVNGEVRNVNQYIGKGKWTIVAIWAHNCHICNEEIEFMSFFHDEHANKDATVLGISIDGMKLKDKAKHFIEKHDLSFPNIIIEPNSYELLKFGGGQFVGTPTFYLYNPKGELLAKNVGPVTIEAIEDFIANN